ncbi:transducin family protein WD-40 repeat family protein [Ichthyophthirius multifiliis]|uniref:Transducin family protein WD-40 repeat family protein n=1 Tax=Ichthyophthirius multifiliis TaxID=5932 RepID=G0QS85_ICHMU|nr:transducin family protein WD-40 repeat family protein [Ichthyophthirius multifiliis]EGR31950.1 transducin family protein WD-40 repeat family protein [Ichthyophthirius multifiliis]|eukprot:XP_004035436.1 transducin family protein WD-40 repeat family protein [Ichthyophthirius multifiliis]
MINNYLCLMLEPLKMHLVQKFLILSNLPYGIPQTLIKQFTQRKMGMYHALMQENLIQNIFIVSKHIAKLLLLFQLHGLFLDFQQQLLQDHYVKIWDTNTISNKQPLLVCQKNPNAGKLFCGSFYEDSPWIFACGNSKGEIFVCDITEDKFIVQKFGDRVDQKYKPDINLVFYLYFFIYLFILVYLKRTKKSIYKRKRKQ